MFSCVVGYRESVCVGYWVGALFHTFSNFERALLLVSKGHFDKNAYFEKPELFNRAGIHEGLTNDRSFDRCYWMCVLYEDAAESCVT